MLLSHLRASAGALSRRCFLASLCASATAKPKMVNFNRPLGAQLYTVRNQLPHDAAAVIKGIAEIGYKEVEIGQPDIERLMPIIKDAGLTAPSGHYDLALVRGVRKDLSWAQAIEQAKTNGLRYMILSYIPPADRGNADAYRAIADDMNRAGEACQKAGLQFGYHNHAFEFAGTAGQRPWDILLSRWDSKLVVLELDVFWLSVAGNIPSEIIRQQQGRVRLVHLKDKAFGTPVQYSEQVPPSAFREVGTGTLEFPTILRACEAAGVQHYIVEQDHTPGSPLRSLRLSYNNLRRMKVKA
jgi:sugar phosphate isomerase/epimerase